MKIMAIDGNSLINRAYYGLPALTSSSGVPTNAVYGFFNTLLKLEADIAPDRTVVCFDLKAPTFRHKMYDGYKAQRKPMPEELAMQFPIIKNALDAMGIPRLEKEGYEADDLLGTLAKKASDNGDSCVIVTGDKDSLQYIDSGAVVCLVKTRMGQTETTMVDREEFMNQYGGLAPSAIVDLKALMGDKSDNIPGVPGIGEKGAMELLQKFGTLKGVYENAEDESVSASVKRKLAEGKDLAFLSYDLALGCLTAPVGYEDTEPKKADGKALYELFSGLQLNNLIKKMDLSAGSAESEFKMPETVECTQEQALSLAGEQPFTMELSEGRGALQFSDKVYVFTVENEKELLSAAARNGFNSFDTKPYIRSALEQGISDKPALFDCNIAAYLLDPNVSKRTPASCASKYLSAELDEHADVSTLCAVSHALWPVLEKAVDGLGMKKLMDELELPLVPVLCSMELCGMKLDTDRLSAYGRELSEGIAVLEKRIFELCGENFNIGSPKQLGVILYEKLALRPVKKTKTGYSTNADALDKLIGKHPVIEDILEWRKLTKLRSTYVEGLREACGPDGRIHTTFNQTVTATGRLSSTDPNMQNIPVRREEGAEIRKFFVAEEGSVYVDADYSQIELRVLAHVANDGAMIDAFNSGEDIHTVTASQVFGVPVEMVTPFMRSSAKAVNFGIVYGISAFSLSEDIHVFPNEAQRYIDAYFQKYSGIKQYLDRTKEQAKKDGWVKTDMGRIRAIPEIKSSNFNIRSFGERVAMNSPIQGTAADIMKAAMILVYKALKENYPQAKLVLQVHDELIVEAPAEQASGVGELLKTVMQSAYKMKVPLLADVSKGENWYDAKG